MENQFFVDSEQLSASALEKKHRLETDPSSRKSHMEYLPGMEQIESDVCENVMSQMKSYDYLKYTAKDVKAALEKTNDVAAAAYVGKVIAEKAKAKGINTVVFDRGGFIYQGKVKALADAAREAGLEF